MRETAGNTKKGIAWKAALVQTATKKHTTTLAALVQTAIKKRTTTLQHKERRAWPTRARPPI